MRFLIFRLMFNVSRAAANHLGLKDLLPETSLPDQLLHQLEILACDSLTLQHRPAEVALALLATNFQQRATREPGHSTALMGFISELQKYCNVSQLTFSFMKHYDVPALWLHPRCAKCVNFECLTYFTRSRFVQNVRLS